MATDNMHTLGGGVPEDPEDLLPEESVLSLDEYLAMHAAVGHRTRYEILYRLVHTGDMSPKELEEAIDIDDSPSTITSTNSSTSASSRSVSGPSEDRTGCTRITGEPCSER